MQRRRMNLYGCCVPDTVVPAKAQIPQSRADRRRRGAYTDRPKPWCVGRGFKFGSKRDLLPSAPPLIRTSLST
jgi:hypothetical protein